MENSEVVYRPESNSYASVELLTPVENYTLQGTHRFYPGSVNGSVTIGSYHYETSLGEKIETTTDSEPIVFLRWRGKRARIVAIWVVERVNSALKH